MVLITHARPSERGALGSIYRCMPVSHGRGTPRLAPAASCYVNVAPNETQVRIKSRHVCVASHSIRFGHEAVDLQSDHLTDSPSLGGWSSNVTACDTTLCARLCLGPIELHFSAAPEALVVPRNYRCTIGYAQRVRQAHADVR